MRSDIRPPEIQTVGGQYFSISVNALLASDDITSGYLVIREWRDRFS